VPKTFPLTKNNIGKASRKPLDIKYSSVVVHLRATNGERFFWFLAQVEFLFSTEKNIFLI
jgi:hypothetical protein